MQRDGSSGVTELQYIQYSEKAGEGDSSTIDKLTLTVQRTIIEGNLIIVPFSQESGVYHTHPRGCVLIHPEIPGAQELIDYTLSDFKSRIKALIAKGYILVNGKVSVDLINNPS